jgi:DNA repair protein RadC
VKTARIGFLFVKWMGWMDKDERTYRIQDMIEAERPRERMAKYGPQALSHAELLAILLRVGVAGENVVQLSQRLLVDFGGLRGLHRASFDEVCRQHGMGPAKAAQLLAAIELGRRIRLETIDEKAAIHSPADAAAIVEYEMADFAQEHLWVIDLDTRNRLIAVDRLYQGSLNSSTVRVGELFRGAIQKNAAAIILVHNHPSGDPTPSPEDVNLTRTAVQAGKMLDIDVLDHLVIGRGRHISLKERGLGFG